MWMILLLNIIIINNDNIINNSNVCNNIINIIINVILLM